MQGITMAGHFTERLLDFSLESCYLLLSQMIFPIADASFAHERRVFFDDAEIVEPRVIGCFHRLHDVEGCVMPDVGKMKC